ncbi:MAG: hypothetical protein WBB52_16570 [Acidimicrobiales bacterium]|jgi:hypothetical protein
MRDLAFLALVVVFFALMTAYLKACVAIVGAEEPPTSTGAGSHPQSTAVTEIVTGGRS